MSFDDSEAAWTAQLLTERLVNHDSILDRPSGRDDLQVQKQQIDKNRNISFRGENVNDCKISILNQWSKISKEPELFMLACRPMGDYGWMKNDPPEDSGDDLAFLVGGIDVCNVN
ncbi:hypothetical protein GUITHDRAFT_105486 [Guillardia theta CCMP2712]|uniref:Uncharacterized protein n=2 Tax=Guillardia theta TaxID=55529 RepID=L1JKM9_GUITC|nr:hypothetical protein GUITHDRAFT_105486 [Guillardia theta CCMP2712]EKX48862.1 hypothetical protein GUITHDRAFT_105486 [Guillardia theta CCMP2712]|eukprot:XP_005835842.1 hypothetical protein GUITHDRAFT_105486 [Guillardia theta CCMP2712]